MLRVGNTLQFGNKDFLWFLWSPQDLSWFQRKVEFWELKIRETVRLDYDYIQGTTHQKNEFLIHFQVIWRFWRNRNIITPSQNIKHLQIIALQKRIELKLDLEIFLIKELRLMPSQSSNYQCEYIPPQYAILSYISFWYMYDNVSIKILSIMCKRENFLL